VLTAKQRTKIDPRITRTRALLINALGELMREKSFEAITVSEVAERATLNRVTFYAHFQDKFELLEEATREMIRKQVDTALPVRTPFSEDKVAALLRLVCTFLADFVGHCPPPHGQLEPLIEKQIKSELYDVFLGWLKSPPVRAYNGAAAPEQAATVSAWALYGAAVQWSQKSKREPVDELVRQVLPLIMSNLQPLAVRHSAAAKTKTASGGSGAYSLLRQFQLSYYN
jgi:AcrR family transcriptional regulator